MPKITINNKEFQIDNSPYILGNIDNENYNEALRHVEEFKGSSEYKGQSVEDIFDILISKEDRETKIDDLAAYETNERFSRQPYNLRTKFDDVKSKLHREYTNRYGSIYDTIVEDVRRLWGEDIQGLNDEVINDLYTKGILNDFSDGGKITDIPEIHKRVQHTLNTLTKEERDKDSNYYKMLNVWARQASDVFRFEKVIGPLKTTRQEFIDKKLTTFLTDYVDDPQYKAVEEELNQKKAAYLQEAKEEIAKNYKSPLQSAKELLSQRKEQCTNLLAEREKLAKDYYKTSLGSRIARWFPFIPRSWSKAGQIQNEIDKIDKTIKDAGYKKNEVENIKKEMKDEKPAVENNNLENKVEVKNNELNVLEDTISLQQSLKEQTVLTESKNDLSKPIESNKSLQKEEIIAK